VNTSYDVKLWKIRKNSANKKPSYTVRWSVGGKEKSENFRGSAQADSYLSDLRQAVKKGEAFDMDSGLPLSMIQAAHSPTVLTFVQDYIQTKWPHTANKTRDSTSDALATVLPALMKDKPGRPDPETLRTALRKYALRPDHKRPEAPPEIMQAIRWLEGASLDMADLRETTHIRAALDALALLLDGKAAAPNTVGRKRAVLHAVLEHAVEVGELDANPPAQGEVEAAQDDRDHRSALGGQPPASGGPAHDGDLRRQAWAGPAADGVLRLHVLRRASSR
jgi:hypothetical protein